MSTHIQAYSQAQKEKGEPIGLSSEMRIAKSSTAMTLGGEDLSRLQLCIEPRKKDMSETYEIFSLTGCVLIGEIVESINYLQRVGSEKLIRWISSINPILEDRIRQKTLPPIITSPLLLHHGNLPDGNHRAIAAVKMHNQSEEVALDALRLQLPSATLATLNALIFLDRFPDNPNGTIRLVKSRASYQIGLLKPLRNQTTRI